MKNFLTTICLILTGSACYAAGSAEGKTPVKPIKVTVVSGIRENISTPGDYVGFKCHFSPNKICLYKIETEGKADDVADCQSEEVNPGSFPAIFEPEQLYLGLIAPSGALQVYPINSFQTTDCTEASTTVIVSPKLTIDF